MDWENTALLYPGQNALCALRWCVRPFSIEKEIQ